MTGAIISWKPREYYGKKVYKLGKNVSIPDTTCCYRSYRVLFFRVLQAFVNGFDTDKRLVFQYPIA